jgi:hypothetical protein
MAEQISNGRGTQYPKFSRITGILGVTNLDYELKRVAELLKESDNKNGQALYNAIVNTLNYEKLSTDITLGQLLYCKDYNCASIYFKILDDVLVVNDVFFNMSKPLTDAQNLYGGKPFSDYTKVYGR